MPGRVRSAEALEALGRPLQDRNIAVALIDSGVAAGHPLVGELAESVEIERSARGGLSVGPASGDALGHGTACAMVISAYCPKVRIHSIKIFDDRLEATLDVLERALAYAVERGVHIINLSARVDPGEKSLERLSGLCSLADRQGIIIVSPSASWSDEAFQVTQSIVAVQASETCQWGEFLIQNSPVFGVKAHPHSVHLPGVEPGGDYYGESIATAHTTGFLSALLERVPIGSRCEFLSYISQAGVIRS